MDKLSDDILIYLLAQMPYKTISTCAHVCKKWHGCITRYMTVDVCSMEMSKGIIDHMVDYFYMRGKHMICNIEVLDVFESRDHRLLIMKNKNIRDGIIDWCIRWFWLSGLRDQMIRICDMLEPDGASKYLRCGTAFHYSDISYEIFSVLFAV